MINSILNKVNMLNSSFLIQNKIKKEQKLSFKSQGQTPIYSGDFEESLMLIKNKYVGTINNKTTIVNTKTLQKGVFNYQGTVDNKKFNFNVTNKNKKTSAFDGTFDNKPFYFEFERQGVFIQTQSLHGNVDGKPVSYNMKFEKPAQEFNYDGDMDLLLLTMSMLGNSLYRDKNSEIILGYSAQKAILVQQEYNQALLDNISYGAILAIH